MSISSIGGSYTKSYGYAKLRAGAGSGSSNATLKEWESKYKNLKFSIGESAFGKSGTGNVTISKQRLQEISGDSEKMAEFEAQLEECNDVAKEIKDRGTEKLVSQGFLFHKDGTLQGWTVAKDYSNVSSKYICTLTKDAPNRWYIELTAFTKRANPYQSNWQARFNR